jgi:hypothetical protein
MKRPVQFKRFMIERAPYLDSLASPELVAAKEIHKK